MYGKLLFVLSLIAASVVWAADTPEMVYQEFHAAATAKNFAEAAKYASSFTRILVAAGEGDKMPLKTLIPKSYKIVSTQIAADGQSATLLLEGHYEFSSGSSPNAKGKILLVKERGLWKVDSGSWSSR